MYYVCLIAYVKLTNAYDNIVCVYVHSRKGVFICNCLEEFVGVLLLLFRKFRFPVHHHSTTLHMHILNICILKLVIDIKDMQMKDSFQCFCFSVFIQFNIIVLM